MFDPITETLLSITMLVSSGVLLAGWLTPIPWQFPNWSKQFVVNKIAAGLVIGSALLLSLDQYVKYVCSN